MTAYGPSAQLAEHRAGLDRGELVLVAEENQPSTRRQGRQHRRHHLEVDHRRLVDHQHVEHQGRLRILSEAPTIRAAAEQAVHGADRRWNCGTYRFAIAQAVEPKPTHCTGDRRPETRRRLAGRRRQADTQRTPAVTHRQRLQERQQLHHGGGLAGTGPSGEDCKAVARRQGTGKLLPVGRRHARGRKQDIQWRAQRLCRHLSVVARPQTGGDTRSDSLLVSPVAPQVKSVAGEYQRDVAFTRADQFGAIERCAPCLDGQACQHPARQIGRNFLTGIALGGQRQHEARVGQRRRQIETDMATPELVARKGGGKDQPGIGLRHFAPQETGKCRVETAQPPARRPTRDQRLYSRSLPRTGRAPRRARETRHHVLSPISGTRAKR